jgi:hypothetical protein
MWLQLNLTGILCPLLFIGEGKKVQKTEGQRKEQRRGGGIKTYSPPEMKNSLCERFYYNINAIFFSALIF